MNLVKSFSKTSLEWISLIVTMLSSIFILVGYFSWRFIFSALSMTVLTDVISQSKALEPESEHLLLILNLLNRYFIPAIIFTFICFGLILWLILRSSFIHLLSEAGIHLDREEKIIKSPKSIHKVSPKLNLKDLPLPGEDRTPIDDKKENIEINQRLYLHILSVLQREGRLIDFFAEDLSQYNDTQIGAAARNIHENCKKILYKFIKPKAILDKTEGDQISIPSNFDVSAIKLTGNVHGEPPFHGILRHKGWQAIQLELPTLTPGQNPHIIAPAEVEIL